MAIDVSILIISYNTREMTVACIRSVIEQTKNVSYEIIVVENASKDGSAEAIAAAYPPEQYPQVRLIIPERNLGFAGGNNQAGEHATGEYILLLNPDTLILDGAIDKAVAFIRETPKAGIVGGRTYFGDMRLNPNSCHGAPTPWSLLCMGFGLSSIFRRNRLFDPESLGKWGRDSVRDVDAVTGCFLLIRADLWKQLGGFDLSFFMYSEDTDLCLRAWKAGYRCVITPDARLIHYGGQSERIKPDKFVRLFRAKAQLFEKYWPSFFCWVRDFYAGDVGRNSYTRSVGATAYRTWFARCVPVLATSLASTAGVSAVTTLTSRSTRTTGAHRCYSEVM